MSSSLPSTDAEEIDFSLEEQELDKHELWFPIAAGILHASSATQIGGRCLFQGEKSFTRKCVVLPTVDWSALFQTPLPLEYARQRPLAEAKQEPLGGTVQLWKEREAICCF
jgi:hypothetical protein